MGLERALWKSGWGTLIEARNSTVAHRVRAVKVLRLPLERAVFLHWNSKEGERGERKGAPWKKREELFAFCHSSPIALLENISPFLKSHRLHVCSPPPGNRLPVLTSRSFQVSGVAQTFSLVIFQRAISAVEGVHVFVERRRQVTVAPFPLESIHPTSHPKNTHWQFVPLFRSGSEMCRSES